MTFLPETAFGVLYLFALSLCCLFALAAGKREHHLIAGVLIANWLATRFCVWFPVPLTGRALADFISIAVLIHAAPSPLGRVVALCFAGTIASYAFPRELLEATADALGYLQMVFLAGGALHGRLARSMAFGFVSGGPGIHGAALARKAWAALARCRRDV